MNLLHAPSDIRRSRQKLATYDEKHDQLRREIEAQARYERDLREDLAEYLEAVLDDPAFQTDAGLI